MTPSELKTYVGREIFIRGVKHLCISASPTALLLIEFNHEDRPIQYIVSHYPDLYGGELIWAQGGYYPFFYPSLGDKTISDALCGAVLELDDTIFYAAMADDDLGARCIGVFTEEHLAKQELEKVMNNSDDARIYCHTAKQSRLSLDEYNQLRDERMWENAYWIEEHEPNTANC